jgi:hypothetical protein
VVAVLVVLCHHFLHPCSLFFRRILFWWGCTVEVTFSGEFGSCSFPASSEVANACFIVWFGVFRSWFRDLGFYSVVIMRRMRWCIVV